MQKVFATLFIIALMLSASLSAVSRVLASPEEEESEKASEIETEDEEEIEATEHSHEEEDKEEGEKLSYEEDKEGDLLVVSQDNTIKFEKDEPQIHIKYVLPNETEIEVEANDFALIEFVDENNDGKIQSEEIRRKLEFDEIAWSLTYTKTVEGNNTILTVTYYANSTDHEIALVMKIYQRRATEFSTIWNATIVYDVDGGADEVKFDLIVSRWTWVNESSKLALLMELESEVEGDVALESASVDKDQIIIRLDSIKIKVGWVKKAKIVAADGTEELVNVTVAYKSLDIELEKSEVELELDVYFIYPHFGKNKLIHDPSVGIEDDPLLYIFTLITPEILLGTAIAATAITVATIAFTRRRRKLQPLETTAPLAL